MESLDGLTRAFWRRRPVFVTGATGLLGAFLVELLVELGAEVTALVRDHVPRARFHRLPRVRDVTVVQGAVEDAELLERALNEYEIETVMHLAAQTIVGTAYRAPRATFAANIQGTGNMLEACRRTATVRRVIVASSDKAYGRQDALPYREDTPLQGTHPYDVSKSCADLLAQAYFATYRLPVCITRCGNFFGGGDLNFNRLVPGTIRSAVFGEQPVIRSDGTFIRDYIYAKDGALAYLFLAERMEETSIHGQAFNFSNEAQVDVRTLVTRILSLMGRTDLEPLIRNEAHHEIPHQYLCARKAREQLGWRPRYTLEQGLAETIAWYRRYFDAQGAPG